MRPFILNFFPKFRKTVAGICLIGAGFSFIMALPVLPNRPWTPEGIICMVLVAAAFTLMIQHWIAEGQP